jgi:uncharacterized protein (DUF885 family)
MFDRRRLLLAGSSLGLLAAAGRAAAGTPEAALDAVMQRIFEGQLDDSPQMATGLGLDVGKRAGQRFKLDDQSQAKMVEVANRQRVWLRDLKAIDRKTLTGMAAVNYDTMAYVLEGLVEGADRFKTGLASYPLPYVLSQLSGAWQTVPDFLDSQHRIDARDDAEAYLSRLADFARIMDQETERATVNAVAGRIPPDFLIDSALGQMTALRATPAAQTTLVESLVRRTKEKAIDGDWAAQASKLVEGPVWTALDRQIALLKSWRPNAVHDAGVWRLPQGEEFYRYATRLHTTTGMTPQEIHKLGNDLCTELTARIDTLMRANGLTEGSVSDRFGVLNHDPRFVFPNTPEGKTQLLGMIDGKVKAISAKLPQWFGTLPKAPLAVKPVPSAIEAGQPLAYYFNGSLDGSRPGIFYINLRDTAEVATWAITTVIYHEGLPGHHLQGTLAMEAKGVPMARKAVMMPAYDEGWGLYAEQVADEMGMYADDPFGQIGYLRGALFRAVRLVVDSGMHSLRWSRERAIKFFVDTLGGVEASAVTEIERYCNWPGQACSYMIGKMTFVRLREAARGRLGSKFDIRSFHDAALLNGSMPLAVLERVIADWEQGRA